MIFSGSGAAIGILRVGYKKLFVYDRDGHHHEFDPLCVLDFYVHESRQRTGCGKQLFDAMILVSVDGTNKNCLPGRIVDDNGRGGLLN